MRKVLPQRFSLCIPVPGRVSGSNSFVCVYHTKDTALGLKDRVIRGDQMRITQVQWLGLCEGHGAREFRENVTSPRASQWKFAYKQISLLCRSGWVIHPP